MHSTASETTPAGMNTPSLSRQLTSLWRAWILELGSAVTLVAARARRAVMEARVSMFADTLVQQSELVTFLTRVVEMGKPLDCNGRGIWRKFRWFAGGAETEEIRRRGQQEPPLYTTVLTPSMADAAPIVQDY